MNLLLSDLDVIETRGDAAAVEITQVEHDSRRVRPGALFCCLPGATADGHDYAAAAVAAGAAGLLCEHLVPLEAGSTVVQAVVPPGRVRPAMARAAAAFHGHPADHLTMVGVTGTNGKTTVAHLLGAVLSAAGTPTTVLGTLSGARTTPEATELQALLARERDRPRAAGKTEGKADGQSGTEAEGVRRAVAMEVSSHALTQARVDGIRFDVAVFTNLSREHLDFHHSMEEYFAAKASLFVPERAARAVIGTGTSWGRRLLDQTTVPAIGVDPVNPGDVRGGPGWTELAWRGRRVTLRLTGRVHATNALLAGEAALALGIPLDDVVRGLAGAPPVPGRLEVVAAPPEAASTVIVDYAHTPDALAAVLEDARHLAAPNGRVLVVFGAGGDRDRGKRPQMGAVASRLADVVVLTSDNPRHEDPAAILADIRAGATASPTATVSPTTPAPDIRTIEDRRAAIAEALRTARPGDVVVVAGKGHETTQEIEGRRSNFDDRSVVTTLLGARS